MDAARTKRIESAIGLIQLGDVDGAINLLENTQKKEAHKKRAPTAFNLFVSKTLKELKEAGIPNKDRMAECGRLWKERPSPSMP